MASTIHSRHLVGRSSQLAVLAERFAAARRGEGSIVIVAGEAGAGKTRLVAEFCAGLAPAQGRCVIARWLEYIQSPYAPFLTALATLFADEPAVVPAKVRAELVHLIPELGDRPEGGERDKLRQFNAMAEAFQRFGNSRCTVLVLEDVHWADRASLELLLHLVPHVRSSGLLIIVTCRSDEPREDNMLRSLLGKLQRNTAVFRTELEPLTNAQMHELIYHALGSREGPKEKIVAICKTAEGNPLFAEELLKTVMQGHGIGSGKPLPATLRETVIDRLNGLGQDDRTVLVQAAAIGRRFQAKLLAEVAQLPVAAALAALKRAIDAQFIFEEKTNGTALFAFRHELIREVLYRELLADEARALHLRIASTLEAQSDREAHVAELAYHFWEANEKDRAAAYSERAADAALAVFAYEDAADAYEHALAGAVDPKQRAALNSKLGRALHQCGDAERAAHAFDAARAFYEASKDGEQAARACLELAVERITLGDAQGYQRLNERALELVRNEPQSPAFLLAHIQLLDLYTSYHWNPGKAQEQVTQAERAIREQPPAVPIDFFEFRSILAIGSGQPDQAFAYTREAVDLATSRGEFRSAVRCLGTFSGNAALSGEMALASAGFDNALAIMKAKNISGLTGNWTLIYYAYWAALRGDLKRACEVVEQLLAAGMDMKSFRIHLAGVGIPVGLALEDEYLIKRCALNELIDFALGSSSVMLVGAVGSFAEYYAADDRLDEARELLHRALEVLEAIPGIPAWDAHRLFVAFARFGDEQELPRMRHVFQRAHESSSVGSTPPHLALFDAFSAARRGDSETAVELSSGAAVQFHEIGWPLHEAQALAAAGRLKEALDLYRRTGDVRNAREIEEELSPLNRRQRRKDELTAREREILTLVDAGKSNRSIAKTLVISERTVESHVSSILNKFGAATRAELIARPKENPL